MSEECPLDVSGFTFSGVPGVIIGHNADIAWGFTNLGPDVTDLYVERVRDDEWFREGEWRPLRTRTETIEVQGQDDETLTIRSTAHGPLLSDVSEDLADVADQAPVDRTAAGDEEKFALALQWTALEPGRTADAIFDLNQASDWDEFRAAVSSFEVPAQNLVYADREGHIGYQAPGRIPIRGPGNDGLLPSAGWLPENDWTGDVVPFEALPRVLDPDEGFVVTANQAVIGPDYPYFLTDDWDKGYRSQRIRDLLGRARRSWSVEEMADLQTDSANPLARRADALPPRPRRAARLLPRGPGPAARLGPRPGRRQRRRGVLQRGLAQPARAHVPRRAARGAVAGRRRPLGGGGDRAARATRATAGGTTSTPMPSSRTATRSCAGSCWTPATR